MSDASVKFKDAGGPSVAGPSRLARRQMNWQKRATRGGHDGVGRTVQRRSRSVVPEWRNGRRAGFKIQCPQGRVGSSPTSGTM